MEMSSHTTPTARVIHLCDWCGDKIEVGDKYRRQAIFDEGKATTWKNHLHCEELTKKLKMFDGDYGEGLSGCDFCDFITEEYARINAVVFDSRNPAPPFKERMRAVREYYQI